MIDLEQQYAINMAKIKTLDENLYRNIEKTDISEYLLDIKEQSMFIYKNNNLVYPRCSYTNIQIDVAKFLLSPETIFHVPYLAETTPGYDFISERSVANIENISPLINKETNLFSFNKYEAPTFDIPGLIMFGVGTGQQIEMIINSHKELHKLTIIDEDYAMMKLSLHIMDWTKIFDYFSQKGKYITIIATKDPKAAAVSYLNNTFANHKFLFMYSQRYMTYENVFFKDVLTYISNYIVEGLKGWGFYDDLRTSLLNTANNIKNGYEVFYNNKKIESKNRVFVIASGPSIDDDIEFIKQNRDNAIICSCGSSIRVLESNNIIPDYHIEIERGVETYNALVDYCKPDFLKKITLIALNVIDTRALALFKKSLVWFRDNDAGAYLTKGDIPKFDFTNPTAVNGLFAFVSHIGFEEIYLFGTDLGYKSIENHHSKYTAYYEDENFEQGYTKKAKKVKANFEDTGLVNTEYTLSWGKVRLENCINTLLMKKIRAGAIKLINCSDGVFINGATPMRSSSLNLDSLDKEKLINEIDSNFNKIENIQELSDFMHLQLNYVDDTINKLLSLFEKKVTSFKDMFKTMFEANLVIQAFIDKEIMVYSLLNGTMMLMFSSIYTHALGNGENEKSIQFINDSFDIVKEFLEISKKDIKEIDIF